MHNYNILNLFDLNSRVVVVTGACGQLGACICQAFKENGATVVGLDIVTDRHREPGVDYFVTDIVKRSEVVATFSRIFQKYGRLDVVINNAGVSTFEPFEERSEASFDWVAEVNLKGTFNSIHSYVKLFDAHHLKKGSIINIASLYGVISPDFRIYTDCDRKNSEVYGATKAGILQMTKYFAAHLAVRNIRVNAISPGGIFNPDNPQGQDFIKNYSFRCPMKRMANQEEMIGALIYLASDAASYTTGANLMIDGGMSCW